MTPREPGRSAGAALVFVLFLCIYLLQRGLGDISRVAPVVGPWSPVVQVSLLGIGFTHMTMTLVWPAILAIVCLVARARVDQWSGSLRHLGEAPPELIRRVMTSADLLMLETLRQPMTRLACLAMALLPVAAAATHLIAAVASVAVLSERWPSLGGRLGPVELWPIAWLSLTVVTLVVTGTAALIASGMLVLSMERFRRVLASSGGRPSAPSAPSRLPAKTAPVAWTVFVSSKGLDATGAKSRDAAIAEYVYDVMSSQGIKVFSSSRSLELKGISSFKAAIDAALQESDVLVAIGTTTAHLNSAWVKYEWDSSKTG